MTRIETVLQLHGVTLQLPAEGSVQQRLFQLVERGELALVEGFEALGFFVQAFECFVAMFARTWDFVELAHVLANVARLLVERQTSEVSGGSAGMIANASRLKAIKIAFLQENTESNTSHSESKSDTSESNGDSSESNSDSRT